MRFQCPSCLSIVGIDDSEAGQAVACGHCESIIAVPTSRTGPGAVLDDFVIEKEVGRGGLATVYLAHQISLDRSVALKILHEQYAEDEEFTTSFLREARAAAQLNHPNIVQAHAVGEEDGIHFFAMEYVQGTTLKNVLAHSGRLVTDRALLITKEIAKALHFAWTSKNLVHRDIKPDNIILTEDGQVKLADLGLARVGKDILQEGSTEILGTPQYIAPELLLGKPADNRTDIYSLGATLFHAVTGQYPYQGNTAAEIARKHISEPLPDPRSIVKDMPEPLAKIICIMMAKRPNHRFSSAEELLEELERVQNGNPPVHTLTKSFQIPIDLSNVEQELEVKPEDEEAEEQAAAAAAKSGADGNGKKLTISKTPKTGGGKRKISFKGKSGKKLKSRARRPGATGAKPDSAADQQPTQPDQQQQTTGPETILPDDQKPAKPTSTQEVKSEKSKKRSSSKLLLSIMVVFGLLAIGLIVGIYFFAQWREEMRRVQDLQAQGLNEAQAAALESYKQFITRNPTYEMALEQAQEILNTHPQSTALRVNIMDAAAPFLEEEVQNLRQDRYQQELMAWRKQARELQEQRRQELIDAQREERRRQAEALRQEQEARNDELRQQRIAELNEGKQDLRKKAIRLARKHQFDETKAIFTAMRLSDIQDFSQWAQNKQETVDLAQRAYDLVRDSNGLLKGERLSLQNLKNRPERAEIVTIGFEFISAEIREKIYHRGEYVRDKIEPVTIPLSALSTQQVVKLMEEAWKRQGGEQAELDLLVGAYLLARGEYLNISSQRLKRSTLTEKADPMLEELEQLRSMVQAET